MKKKSMVTTGMILLGLANVAWDFYDYTSFAEDFRQQEINQAAIRVAYEMIGLRQSTPENLRSFLQLEQDKERISFFILKSDREPASSSLPDKVSPDFQAVVDGKARPIYSADKQRPQAVYVADRIGNQDVVLGKLIDENYIENTVAYNRHDFYRNVFVQTLMLILIISFAFRELIQVMRKLQWGGFVPSVGEASVDSLTQYGSHEAQSIASAFGRFSEQQFQSQSELERLRSHILPSLQNELSVAQEPPYEFESLMVRIDINQSTKVYANPEYREIQQYWFDYFKVNCAEIATRYYGFVHEELGDEVIIYFKCENQKPAAALNAIACVRDVFGLSKDINAEIQKRFEFQFCVKAAIAFGKLRVFKSSFASGKAGAQDRRLKIEGAGGDSSNPFLSTVRMLDFVEDKTVNSCVATKSIVELGNDLIKTNLPCLENIPNLSGQEEYFWITSFRNTTEVQGRHIDSFFLANETLYEFLQWIIENPHSEMREEWIHSRLQAFRPVKLGRVSAEMRQAYVQCLVQLEAHATSPEAIKVLATLISMAPQLINEGQPPAEFDSVIRYCMLHTNDRVQANAIQVWGQLDLKMSQIKEHIKAFRHNRSLGNFLVASLKAELDKSHLKLLGKMMEDKNEFMRAAGAYAFGEVAGHYKKTNPSVMEMNPVILSQIEILKRLSTDTNQMVRKQAEKALAKF